MNETTVKELIEKLKEYLDNDYIVTCSDEGLTILTQREHDLIAWIDL